MSGKAVIQVENLSKHYRLGSIGGATLREDLGRWWARARGKPDPWSRVDGVARANDGGEGFWALRDVSFEVREGEVLGVIGRNGAGKSTLLKILSRITSPTRGRALIRGRVGSLLEVGTGFHPELTGRENIYLNGAILGMTRAEITRKLDEIIEFAEMAKFIDTPVKRYSSGMTVRLAFAVAAHLEPEILVVDEVLAVGDVAFQQKCLKKMEGVSKAGRTILFVSHNLGAVGRICSRGLLLDSGQVAVDGHVKEAVSQFANLNDDIGSVFPCPGDANSFRIVSLDYFDPKSGAARAPVYGEPLAIRVKYYSPVHTMGGAVELSISTEDGYQLFRCSTNPDSGMAMDFSRGYNHIDLVFDRLMLSAGRYLIGAGLTIPNQEWLYWEPAGARMVVSPGAADRGMSPTLERNGVGLLHSWRV